MRSSGAAVSASCLPAGSTPRGVYTRAARRAHGLVALARLLRRRALSSRPTIADRNSTMAADAWLDHVPIPRSPRTRDAGRARRRRGGARLRAKRCASVVEFDLVLLGLGEDGHTASLFPDHDWGAGAERRDTLAVLDAPKPPPQRVSLSARRLESCARRAVPRRRRIQARRGRCGGGAGADIRRRVRSSAVKQRVDVLVESMLLPRAAVPVNEQRPGARARRCRR